MKTFDVSCFDKISGKLAWSVSQEAESPAEAISNASLPPAQRGPFVRRIHQLGLDELPTLIVDHPGADLGRYLTVRAQVIP